MSSYQSTEVYKYIIHLEKYLKGDLQQFHKICNEVEIQERTDIGVSDTHGMSSTSGPGRRFETSSLSLTSETTRGPVDTGSTLDRPDSGSTGETKVFFRSTIPHTLTLFSTIDILGYLSGSNNDPLQTYRNFEEFFKLSPISVSSLEVRVLNLIFRQGLVHIYFPKLNVGISYHSRNPIDKLFLKTSSGIVLNVNCLEEIVIKVLEGIRDTPELYEQMERRYTDLVSEYESRQGELLTQLESIL